MLQRSFIFAILLLGSSLSACSFFTTPPLPLDGTTSSSTSNSVAAEAELITRNVNYVGTVEDLMPSIVMQGTHLLRLLDGRSIFLSSTDVNLDLEKYVGKKVELRGSVQATVEGNSLIMRVEQVTILDTASSSSSGALFPASCSSKLNPLCVSGTACVDDPSDACDPTAVNVDCPGTCQKVTLPVSSSSSGTSVSSSVSSSASSKSGSSTSSRSVSSVSSTSSLSKSSVASSANPDREASIMLLSKQDYASAAWTQKYCTGHMGFCVPVHKNWFFKSFGATTTNLWHVEFSGEAIDVLGDGVITLNLVAGTSAGMNADDGEVRAVGTDVIAFRDWKGTQHFEIIADARLQAAVEYILNHIERFAPAQ